MLPDLFLGSFFNPLAISLKLCQKVSHKNSGLVCEILPFLIGGKCDSIFRPAESN